MSGSQLDRSWFDATSDTVDEADAMFNIHRAEIASMKARNGRSQGGWG